MCEYFAHPWYEQRGEGPRKTWASSFSRFSLRFIQASQVPWLFVTQLPNPSWSPARKNELVQRNDEEAPVLPNRNARARARAVFWVAVIRASSQTHAHTAVQDVKDVVQTRCRPAVPLRLPITRQPVGGPTKTVEKLQARSWVFSKAPSK